MRIRVLGSSAGGGFPQWNCNCPNCDGVRRGTLKARARTQSSIAVTANDTSAAPIDSIAIATPPSEGTAVVSGLEIIYTAPTLAPPTRRRRSPSRPTRR